MIERKRLKKRTRNDHNRKAKQDNIGEKDYDREETAEEEDQERSYCNLNHRNEVR